MNNSYIKTWAKNTETMKYKIGILQVTAVLPEDLFGKLESFRRGFTPKISRAEAVRIIMDEYFVLCEEIEEEEKGFSYIRSLSTGEALRLPSEVASEWVADTEFTRCTKEYFLNHSVED